MAWPTTWRTIWWVSCSHASSAKWKQWLCLFSFSWWISFATPMRAVSVTCCNISDSVFFFFKLHTQYCFVVIKVKPVQVKVWLSVCSGWQKLFNDWTGVMWCGFRMQTLRLKEDFRGMKVSAYVTLTHLHFGRLRCVQQHRPGMLTPGFTKVARANHHAGFYPVKC